MAGSFNHLLDEDGSFDFEFIENLGDAHECAEECFWLVHKLLKGDRKKLDELIKEMYKLGDITEGLSFK